jgi:hypothetical protein
MRLQKLEFSNTRSFSSFFLDYIQKKDSLKPFYSRFPEVENFEAQIAEKSKSYSEANRKVLADVLNKQYQEIDSVRNR